MPAIQTTARPPLVRAEILVGCREAAEEVGADLDTYFAAHGIDPQLIDSPSGFIEKPRLLHALQAVADHYDCQHFGFLAGKHQPPLRFGPPAQLLKLAPSLGAALDNVSRFTELYTQGVRYDVVVEPRSAIHRRTNTYRYDICPVQLDMIGMVQVFKMFQSLCGNDWKPISIYFDQAGPRQKEQLTDYFSCPVLFDRRLTCISFAREDLTRQIPTANKELLQIVEGYFASHLHANQKADDVVIRTRVYIRTRLGTGLCNLLSCAQQLGIHPRTLQRELRERGFTFKQLMLATRMEMARDHLSDSDMPLSELAEMLGYENGSAFSRAFKRQHGVSPLKWKTDSREK